MLHPRCGAHLATTPHHKISPDSLHLVWRTTLCPTSPRTRAGRFSTPPPTPGTLPQLHSFPSPECARKWSWPALIPTIRSSDAADGDASAPPATGTCTKYGVPLSAPSVWEAHARPLMLSRPSTPTTTVEYEPHATSTCPKRLLIEARWGSQPLAFAGKLQLRRLTTRAPFHPLPYPPPLPQTYSSRSENTRRGRMHGSGMDEPMPSCPCSSEPQV
jgi:hypothetical protein